MPPENQRSPSDDLSQPDMSDSSKQTAHRLCMRALVRSSAATVTQLALCTQTRLRCHHYGLIGTQLWQLASGCATVCIMLDE